jgi:hypothetical protein
LSNVYLINQHSLSEDINQYEVSILALKGNIYCTKVQYADICR